MSQQYYQQRRMTPGVKFLLISIASVFVLQNIFLKFMGLDLALYLGFSPARLLLGRVWTLIAYPFLHDTQSLWHILLNGVMLYMLGPELENRWGTKKFLQYYALCAIGGGILQTLIFLIALPFGGPLAESLGAIPIIGASGALYGLMMAFGKLYKNAQVLVALVIPVKAGHFVIAIVVMELFASVFGDGTNVAHLVHLGGLITGFILLKWQGDDLSGGWRRRRKAMDRDEVRSRLKMVVNKDFEDKNSTSKYPITWN